MTILKFPRDVKIDIENIPDDFEDQIRQSFHDYTEGTAKEYRFEDKLAYIDLIRKYAHKSSDTEECVKEMLRRDADYMLDEYGQFPDTQDYIDIECMARCFDYGRTNLHDRIEYERLYIPSHYIGHVGEIVCKLIYRAVKVVMDYED